jgi:acyl carrier protein
MDVDWHTWRASQPSTAASPKFSLVLQQREADPNAPAGQLRSMLVAASPAERSEIASLALTEIIGETMRMSVDNIDVHVPLTEMGIDSLMALELQAGIQKRFGVQCSILELQKGGDIAALARTLVGQMDLPAEQVPA